MKNNDILLFNLHRKYVNQESFHGGFSGIYLIAAFIEENGFEGQAYAGLLADGKKLIDYACANGIVKVVGLYCDFDNVTENIFLSNYIKEQYGLPVIVGGPQATALGADFFECSACDAIVRYEGELTVLDLMRYFVDGIGDLSAIKGISYYKDGVVHINTERPLIENLDSLPFLDSRFSLDDKFRQGEANIMTGRGCPFHCSFCHEGHHTRKVRFRSVENVLQEVDQFLETLGDREGFICFTDDTFTLVPERVKGICEGLAKRREKYNFEWFCEGHIHTLYLHPEMIDYLVAGGINTLQLGIESGVQSILDAYRKGCTLDEIRDVIVKCESKGINHVYGNIILGGPGYSAEAYEQHLEFAKELYLLSKGILNMNVVSCWPLPETDITCNPEKYNLKIVDYDFLTSSSDFPMIEVGGMGVWDICVQSNDMKKALDQHILDMYHKRLVPEDRIIKWMKHYLETGSDTYWLYVLRNANPALYGYYCMLNSNDIVSLADLLEDELWDYHPMRVESLYNNCYLKDSKFVVYGHVLSELERELVRYSLGRLSLYDIVDLFIQKNSWTKSDAMKMVREGIKSLADKRVVVFSKY